jgi:hypothetical protein
MKKAAMDDVPVVVGSVKTKPEFPMTRCTYFVVQSDVPRPGTAIRIGGRRLPRTGRTGTIT